MGRIAKSINVKSSFRWKAAYAAVAGTAHEYEGVVCQDAVAVEHSDGALAACVCDGAGSARLSHLGASAVAREISRLLVEHTSDVLCGKVGAIDIIKRAREVITAEMLESGGEMKDYACTLVGLLLTGNKAVTIHLGDGLIATVEAGIPEVLSAPDNDEFVNYTTFVTSDDACDRLRMKEIGINPFITSFAVMSDGPQASLYNRQKNTVSQVVEQMASWLDNSASEDVSRDIETTIRTHFLSRTHDDCAIVLIRRENLSLKFVCPICHRWDLKRYRRGTRKHFFRIKCESCGNVMRLAGEVRKSYPQDVREWVKHLAKVRKFKMTKLRETTGISKSTLWAWLQKDKDKL